MKRITWLLAITAIALTLTSCANLYQIRGLDEYSDGRSSVEIDCFCGVTELNENFDCLESDYFYACREQTIFYNVCETALLYFRYDEEDYERAKEYYVEEALYLGDEPTEVYGDYKFYDYYEKRSKDEFYHGDDYPEAFKRVAFNDVNHTIVLLGVYTTDQVTKEIEQDVLDWGAFLKKYFGGAYSFDE